MTDITSTLSRKASRANLGGYTPSDDPFISWFGKVLISAPGERWPTWNGVPMMPLFQFNLSELPYRPDNLSDIGFITAFVNQRSITLNAPNGEGWVLRTYKTKEELIPVDLKQYISSIKPLPIRWVLIDNDYPCWPDVPQSLGSSELKRHWAHKYPNQDCTKIGGWPSYMEPDVSWRQVNRDHGQFEYVIQLDSELKTNWEWPGECFAYLCRGIGASKGTWTLKWET